MRIGGPSSPFTTDSKLSMMPGIVDDAMTEDPC
jgi:hypothetical protein